MADYRLTVRAADDLAEIAHYTIHKFGQAQARRYRDGLDACFRMLASNPMLGADAGDLAEGLRRFVYRSHLLFYSQAPDGILIVRVLHERRDTERVL